MVHPVERKLKTQILPYLVMAKKLDEWKQIWIYTIYLYCGEIFLFIGSIGLTNPIVTYLTGGAGTPADTTTGAPSTIIEFLTGNPYAWVVYILLISWALMKFYVSQNDLMKKYTFVKSFQSHCQKYDQKMRNKLDQKNPIPDLDQIRSDLEMFNDTNSIEGSWPYSLDDPSIKKKVDEIADELVKQYQGAWEVMPDAGPTGGN